MEKRPRRVTHKPVQGCDETRSLPHHPLLWHLAFSHYSASIGWAPPACQAPCFVLRLGLQTRINQVLARQAPAPHFLPAVRSPRSR